jgi:hypothetical protein
LVDGEPKLVSEGLWFWHPEMKKIKGYFTAIEMPVAFFDYTTRFEGNRMVNELRAFSTAGSVDLYVETWEFTGTDSYQWTLSQPAADSLTKIMGGTYSRK